MAGTLDPVVRNVAAAILVAAAAIGASYGLRKAPAPIPSPAATVVEHTLEVRLERVEPAGAAQRVTEVALEGDVIGDSTDPGVWERLRVVALNAAENRRGVPTARLVLTARVSVSLARRVPPAHLRRAKSALREAGVEDFSYAPISVGARPRAALPGPRTVVPVELRRAPGAGLEVVLDGRRAGTDADEGTWSLLSQLARAARRRHESGSRRVVFEIRGNGRVTTRDLAAAADALLAVGIPDVTYADGLPR